MKIPFSMTFRGILLSGKDREKARIEYELNGEEKDRALLALNYDTDELKKLNEYRIKKNDIDLKYNKISQYDYDLEMVRINYQNKPETEQKIAELDLLLNYKKINGVDYCKEKNDILGKPWVAIKSKYDEDADPDNMEVEVAYNKTFIKNMKAKGLPGDTDEEIVEQWLKLFFIANLDEDDLSMLEEEKGNDEQRFLRKSKIDNNTTFIS